jgi:hypothetical protein
MTTADIDIDIRFGGADAPETDPELDWAFEPEPIILPACAACGGDTTILGELGRRLWLRCRYCGLDQGHLIPLEG